MQFQTQKLCLILMALVGASVALPGPGPVTPEWKCEVYKDIGHMGPDHVTLSGSAYIESVCKDFNFHHEVHSFTWTNGKQGVLSDGCEMGLYDESGCKGKKVYTATGDVKESAVTAKWDKASSIEVKCPKKH